MELALSMSSRDALRIGTVPWGHDSPEIVHAWNLASSSVLLELLPFGLSGGSCNQKLSKISTGLIDQFDGSYREDLTRTDGLWPRSFG